MEYYPITFQNQSFTYSIIYKNKKNISIKVKAGQIIVSAPYHISRTYIEKCLYQHQKRLLQSLVQYHPYVLYQDQGYVFLFNQKVTLILRDVQQMKCQRHQDVLYVYHHSLQKCVEKYLKEILYDYIVKKIEAYLKRDFDFCMPNIEIKKYKSRWGSCFYQEHKVTFSLSLVHLSYELIDYVIVHELCHFLQANHSRLFYQEIEKRMPDYKMRQQQLKEKHI